MGSWAMVRARLIRPTALRAWRFLALSLGIACAGAEHDGANVDDGSSSLADTTASASAAEQADDDDAADDDATTNADTAADDDDSTGGEPTDWPEYDTNPFVFELAFPVPVATARGSIFVHEVDGDGLLDFVVTAEGSVSVHDHFGALLWVENVAIHLPDAANGGTGYPGRHAPGAIAADVDGDGDAEIAFVGDDGIVRIRDGATGAPVNAGAETAYTYPGAQAIAVADFRGLGDRDALVQYSQSELRAIALEDGSTLWHVTDWAGMEHSAVRVADMTGDGLDEVIGPHFLGPDGARINAWDLAVDRGTVLVGLDSLAVGDVVPGFPLEIALAETAPDESGIGLQSGETIVVNPDAILWGTTRPSEDIPPTGQCATEKDPDKLAIGEFDPARAGLEIMARSACANHPWVMDADGAIVATWNVADTAPDGWYLGGGELPDSEGGIDVVTPIQWDADGPQRVLLKERHLDRKAALVDPMSGTFHRVFGVVAARTYVADIAGDYREEVVVVEPGEAGNGRVLVFWNDATNPTPTARARRWDEQHYRRIKQNWNYYSP
jgi:hypothetical protein